MTGDANELPNRNLAQLQRWMQTVIMHPGGVEQGAASAAARAELETAPRELDEIIEPSEALTSAERLSIYNRAYFARLLECLAEQFPILRRTMGDELFGDFALAYLIACPSQSYTLGQLGTRFADYLAETRPARAAGESDEPDWPEFLVDLARLEWSIGEVFDGPGAEQEAPLDPARLQQIAPEDWPHLQLETVPCLRLLAQRFPVNDFYATVRKEDRVPEFPSPKPSYMALSRRQYVVRRFPLSQVQFEVLQALVDGEPVGVAVQRAAEVGMELAGDDFDLDSFAQGLQQWFVQWSAEGFFLAARVAPQD
jgi:hypothetical protein